MIGLCTDSSAELPAALAEQLQVEIVPLTVTIDGDEHLDGIGIDSDAFYALFDHGHRPVVAISEPSPGQFAAAYEDLIARGCTSILSVHLSPTLAPTLNPARIAARSVDVPVRVIDTGTGGFAMGGCVWAAREAIDRGGSLDAVAAAAEHAAATVNNTVLLRADTPGITQYTMFTFHRSGANVLGRYDHAVDAINAITSSAVTFGTGLRVGIGHTDCGSKPLADAIEDGIGAAANVLEVVRYRIGPAMGALTGPGAVACVMFPGP
jgi:fatty acid-binding protein DegV